MFNFGTTSAQDAIGNITSSSDGPDYGLSLTIDIESGYYMRYGMSPSEGVSIILSEQNKLPAVLSRPIKIGESHNLFKKL